MKKYELNLINSKILINKPIIISLFSSLILVLFLTNLFEPRWHTNDDVGMSMIAHGYGISFVGSPNIVFSNVLWGHLVRAIPSINGILGYSIATLSVLFAFGALVVYSMLRLGLGYTVSFSLLGLLIIRPVLFPQFTINAGLLAVGCIISLNLYAMQKRMLWLILGCILAFVSFLIRKEEFLLVLIVSLPLLPWKVLLLSRKSQISIIFLIFIILISILINNNAYQSYEWIDFNELRPAVSPIVDFNAGIYLQKDMALIEKYGFSKNDLDLLGNFYFTDQNIANPQILSMMISELGQYFFNEKILNNILLSVKNLFQPALIPLLIAAAILFILKPSLRLALCWALFIFVIIILGVIGRPGVLRVVLPLISLLIIASLLDKKINRIGIAIIFSSFIVNSGFVFYESRIVEIKSKNDRLNLPYVPSEVITVWGAAFPFETVYPVLGFTEIARQHRLNAFGTFSKAPFSVSFLEEKFDRGFIKNLVSEKGVEIVGSPYLFKLLNRYCLERFNRSLNEISSIQFYSAEITRLRCEEILNIKDALNFWNDNNIEYGYATDMADDIVKVLSGNKANSILVNINNGSPELIINSKIDNWLEKYNWSGEIFLVLTLNESEKIDWNKLAAHKIIPKIEFSFANYKIYIFKNNNFKNLPGWNRRYDEPTIFFANKFSHSNIGYLIENSDYSKSELIAEKNEIGALYYGPYVVVEPGKYVATFDVSSEFNQAGTIKLDVATSPNEKIIAEKIIFNSNKPENIYFNLESPSVMEFRVWALGSERVSFKSVTLQRIP